MPSAGQGRGLQVSQSLARPQSGIRGSNSIGAALSHLTHVEVESFIRTDFDRQQELYGQQAASTVSPNGEIGDWGQNHHSSTC